MSAAQGEAVVRRRLVLGGYVQGVGFRYWAVRSAQSFGVGGYVRNMPDGRVEAVVEGLAGEVDAFVVLLRQGPPAGRVTEIQTVDEEPRGETAVFRVEF